MNLFLLHPHTKIQQDEPIEHLPVPIVEHKQNITNGGEFLDDSIRMKEQPFIAMRGEESIAPGGPDDLL